MSGILKDARVISWFTPSDDIFIRMGFGLFSTNEKRAFSKMSDADWLTDILVP